ncbi:T3SS effector HopA1 family protein [Streptomyces lydicus]
MTAPVIARILADPDALADLRGKNEAAAGREIYRRFHLGIGPGSTDADDDTVLLDTVRSRLADRRRPSSSWTYRSGLADGRLVVRRDDGLEVAVAVGDIESVKGEQVTLQLPSLEPGVMNGWIWFHGSTTPGRDELTARIYLCLPTAERAKWWSALVADLDDQAHVFSAKIIRRREERARPDSVVIYCRTPDVPGILSAVRQLVPPGQLGSSTAGFAAPVCAGISVGVPQDGEDPHASLGMNRATSIARLLETGPLTESALSAVAECLERQRAQVTGLLKECA